MIAQPKPELQLDSMQKNYIKAIIYRSLRRGKDEGEGGRGREAQGEGKGGSGGGEGKGYDVREGGKGFLRHA